MITRTQLVQFDQQNVNVLCLHHHYVNSLCQLMIIIRIRIVIIIIIIIIPMKIIIMIVIVSIYLTPDWFQHLNCCTSESILEANQNKSFLGHLVIKVSFIRSISSKQITVNLQLGLHLLRKSQQLKGKKAMMVCIIPVYFFLSQF